MHTHTQNPKPDRSKSKVAKLASKGIAVVGLGFASLVSSVSVYSQGPAIAYPNYNWSYSDHSSTYQEGAMKGQAAVLSAAAELNYLNSMAAINFQEAQRRAIENNVAYAKAYLERKEMRDEYWERYRPRPFVGEARQKMIEYYRPKKLSATQFDAESGKITWPHILRQPQYAPVRNQVDTIFANRTFETSGNGSDSQLQIKKLVKTFAALVRENLHSMSAEQYIEVQGFLRSVDAEAKLPVPPKPEQAEVVDPPANGAPAIEANPQAKLSKAKQVLDI